MPRMYCSHVAYCATLDVQTLTTSRLQEILAVRGGAKTYYFLDVPTFTTSRLPRDPSSQRWNYAGEKWPMNFAWNARLPRSIQESFTCRKSRTWDRQLYFPSEGRRAEDFFALKKPTASAGFEPANLGTKDQRATSRPPKPLWLRSLTRVLLWTGLKRIMHGFRSANLYLVRLSSTTEFDPLPTKSTYI